MKLPSLSDPDLYESQIHRLATRRNRMRWRVPKDDISQALDGHAREIAKKLARSIPREGYEFQPLLPHAAMLSGKPRIIYQVDTLDAVVWSAYVRVLSATIDARLGDHLYSYRIGHSQFGAVSACVDFLRAHVAAHPDPRTRGLYVLRRDIRRYDEAIRVDDASSLWTTLHELTAGTAIGESAVAVRLMRSAFRPPIMQDDGSVACLECGTPTGIPTQTIACNVYLLPVDRAMLAIEGGYYSRFGDDIFFAHPDLEVARHASNLFARGIERLGLKLNTEKSLDYWLTGVGRANTDAPSFIPARKLPYLGFDVGFDGSRLRTDKRRQLLRDLRTRVDQAHALVADRPLAERADTIAGVVRDVLDPTHGLAHRYTSWLRAKSLEMSDLRQLDLLIARHCAERLTGRWGVRAFRELPPKRLYTRHQLPSITQAWVLARRRHRSDEP